MLLQVPDATLGLEGEEESSGANRSGPIWKKISPKDFCSHKRVRLLLSDAGY